MILIIILAHFFAFSFFAKMRKKFWILCKKSEENEEIAKENFTYKNHSKVSKFCSPELEL
jgi:hypothetical protein